MFYQELKEVLLKLGWKKEDLLFEPVMFEHGRAYRPDLVLLYNLFPLAVVEIKREIISPELIAFNIRELADIIGTPYALITNKMQTLLTNAASGELQTLVNFPTPKELWTALGREWNPNDPRLYSPYPLTKTYAYLVRYIRSMIPPRYIWPQYPNCK